MQAVSFLFLCRNTVCGRTGSNDSLVHEQSKRTALSLASVSTGPDALVLDFRGGKVICV